MNNICNICGANYVYKNGKWVCPACDNIKQEEITNEEVVLLTNASTKLRMADFDDAEELYRDCIKKYPNNAEAYWGLLLSRYGIKYEEDLDGKKVPTVYATSIESILDDKDYKKALSLADKDTEKYYKQQAQKFESIRKEWVDKASKEPPFDIFICFKDSDAEKDISRTDDSYEAQNLYTYLMSKGYSVFFSRESLRDKVAERYEPYIFNALNTAHVMIIYSSSKEYLESTWVKNEWSRFLKKIKNKQKQENSLILAYEKMKPSEFPKEFNSVQCMDASQKTFYSDLEKHIDKVINKAKAPVSKIERVDIKENIRHKKKTINEQVETREIGTYQVEQLSGDEETQVKTAYKFLEKNLYTDALEIFERILDKNEKNGQAILGRTLARLEVPNVQQIINANISEDKFEDIELAISYSKKADALNIISQLKDTCLTQFKKNNLEFAKNLMQFILQYKSDNDEFFDDIRNIIISLVDNREKEFAVEIFDFFLKYRSVSTDMYLQELKSFISLLMRNYYYKTAVTYYDKYVEIFPNDTDMLWKGILMHINCSSDEQLPAKIINFKHFDKFETLLSTLSKGSKRQVYVNSIIEAVIDAGKNNDQDNIETLAEIFDNTLKYTESNKSVTDYVFEFAKVCQSRNQFELAEKYYALLIGEDEHNHKAYWGLLQSKLKASNNTELIQQPVIITTLPEFHSAIVAAGDDDKSVDRYIELKAKQISYLENQKIKEEKSKIRRRKIGIFSSIVAIIVAIITGFSGWKMYYNANNTLLYTLNSSGTGYIVSAGKYYNEKSITIPRCYNGKLVTEIAANAFKDKDLEYVSIPNTVEKIGNNAFYNCDNLKTINLNITESKDSSNINDGVIIQFRYPLDSYTIIKDYYETEMQYNEELNYWEIHKGIDFASTTNNKLVKAVYDGVVTSIYNNVTDGYVVEITHNNSLKTRYMSLASTPESYVYEGATVSQGQTIGLTSNTKKDSYNSTGYVHFEVELDGTRVNPHDYFVSSSNVSTSTNPIQTITYENKLATIGEYAFYNCSRLEEFKTCDTITTIGPFAFANCSRLESFELPSELKRIEAGTFQGAFGYKDTTISLHDNIEFIGSNAFNNCSKLVKIEVSERDAIPESWDSNWKGETEAVVEWTMNITFDYQGATANNTVTKTSVTTGKPYQLPIPTKEGYIFDGWYSDRNGEGTKYSYANGYSINNWSEESSIKVYANWIANNNSIIFNGNGATSGEMENFIIPSGESKTLPANEFVRDGYTFAGWATNSNGDVIYEDCGDYVMGINPTNVLYAIWTANTNGLSFNGNGPNMGNGMIWGSMDDISVKTDETITLPANTFIKNGYRFAGWATTPSGNVVYPDRSQYTMGTSSSVTLYAKWQPIDYTITLVLNGGTYNGETVITYNAESEPFTIQEATREGYAFNGWTQQDVGGASKTITIQKGTIYNKTFTASWTPNTNEIIFNGNGATSGTMSNQNIKTGETKSLNTCLFEKEGYDFSGWSTTSDGEVEYLDGDTYVMGPNSSYTLYAVWDLAVYTITYRLDDGINNVDNRNLYTMQTETFYLYEPSREYYLFDGWYKDSHFAGEKISQVTKGSLGNITLYAKWIENACFISSVNELKNISNDLTKTYVLKNDLNLGGIEWSPIGSDQPFTGIFDGQNYTISNFKIRSVQTYTGLFGYVKDATIRNIKINNVDIEYSTSSNTIYSGGLIAYAKSNATVENCEVSGTIKLSTRTAYIGGIVGYVGNLSTLNYCNSYVDIQNETTFTSTSGGGVGPGYVGGIVGYSDYAQISCSYASGQISCNNCSSYAGGIVGCAESTTISNCYTLSSVSTDSSYYASTNSAYSGGIVAKSNYSNISTCYSMGNIIAKSPDSTACAGGIVGDAYYTEINNCFSTGKIQSTSRIGSGYCATYAYSGNIIASKTAGNVNDCYCLNGQTVTAIQDSALGLPSKTILGSNLSYSGILQKINSKWDNKIWELSDTTSPTLKDNNNYLSIIYILGGGTNHENNPTLCLSGETISFNEPTKTGYTFNGWYNNPEFLGNKITTIITNTNIKIYAKWEPNTNELIFDGNGSTSGTMTNSYIKTGDTVVLKLNQFKKEWFDFVGWSTNPNGEVEYEDGETFIMGPNSSYTLYAVWQERIINISSTSDLSILQSDSNNGILAKYELDNNIDLNGAEWNPITEFAGIFNGNGYFISNFKITEYSINSNNKYAFIQTNKGVIKDLSLSSINISFTEDGDSSSSSSYYVGILASINEGEISNCYTSGSIKINAANISSPQVGGFVAYNKNLIKNSYSNIDIYVSDDGSVRVGGFVAHNISKISTCYSVGNINVSANGGTYYDGAGGFVGSNGSYSDYSGAYHTDSLIENSFTTVNLDINGLLWRYAYFAGYDGGVIENCYRNSEQKCKYRGSSGSYNDTGISLNYNELATANTLSETLKFDSTIWNLSDGVLPVLSYQSVITFDRTSGTGTMEDIPVQKNTIITLPNNVFEKYAYDFKGWATSPDGEVVYEDGDNLEIGTSKIYRLYAVWEERIRYISTVAELKSIEDDYPNNIVYNRYLLANDLTIDDNWESIRYGSAFRGHFDGCGYTINFNSTTSQNNSGLFYYIYNEAIVKNLVINCNINITKNTDIGFGALAYQNSGTVINCKVTGSIIVESANDFVNVGGFVDLNTGTIRNCYSEATIVVNAAYTNRVGGICARNNKLVNNCYSTGKLTTLTTTHNSVYNILGGIVGVLAQAATVSDCFSTAELQSTASNAARATNGIVGQREANSTMTNCYFYKNQIIKEYYGTNLTTKNNDSVLSGNYVVENYTNTEFTNMNFNGFVSIDNMQSNVENVWKFIDGKLPILYFENYISYNGNGATFGDDFIEVENNETTIKRGNFQKSGFELKGWATTSNGEVVYSINQVINLEDEKNYILFAVWEEITEVKNISSKADLLNIQDDINNNRIYKYTLKNNIDLEGTEWTPIQNFNSIFDGCGYTISNFVLKDENNSGLFSNNYGVIRRLKISNAQLISGKQSGFISAQNDGIIENCLVVSSVINSDDNSISEVGGIVGYNRGTINSCYTDVTFEITLNPGQPICIGGIVGRSFTGNINNCFALGTNNLDKGLNANLIFYYGYVVGDAKKETINNCYKSQDDEYDGSNISIDSNRGPDCNVQTLTDRNMFTKASIYNENNLNWNSDIWNIVEGSLPTLKVEV